MARVLNHDFRILGRVSIDAHSFEEKALVQIIIVLGNYLADE